MNNEMARDRLQQVADAAIAGNRLMARLELESALEFAEQHPAVWFWHAWTAGSPAEAKASLQRVAAIWPDHPLAAAGLAWVEGLEQLASGESEDSAESLGDSGLAATEAELDIPAAASAVDAPSEAVPAPQDRSETARADAPGALPEAAPDMDLESNLLATLAAIHDEVFATLYVPEEHDTSELNEAAASHLEGPAAMRRSVLGKFRTAHR